MNENGEENRHAGKPGKPGQRGTEHRGGTGGEGGAGGEGQTEGGTGGAGGAGGQMGPMGPTGPRGYGNRWGLVGYAFLVAGVLLAFWLTYQQGQENAKANDALCVLRGDLERRVADSNDLLDKNEGDIFGIPRELIVSSRDNQQDTVDALRVLDCT